MSASAIRRHEFVVAEALDGSRLDQVIAAQVEELSRRRARVVIELGGVFVDRKRVKVASRKLRRGQRVEVVLGGAFERATKRTGTEARELDESQLPAFAVLFEDDDVVVVNKPAGLLTAPTPESDRGNLADLLRRGGREQLHVVHRLDLPTSGVLVFAKSVLANRELSDRFRVHDIEREYRAVVIGAWPEDVGDVVEPVAGREARTHFRVLERFGERATLLEATLFTGRTHQIRKHVSGRGCPVAGDRRYGAPAIEPPPPRLALHAARLGFRHPRTGQNLDYDVPVPDELTAWLDLLRAS